MLLLKGNQGKSFVVDAMMSRKHVCTIAYCDHPIQMLDWWIVDSKEYGISELIESIEGIVLEEINNDDMPFVFLVIYTNEKEEDLVELFDWIESNERKFDCFQVLVTCK